MCLFLGPITISGRRNTTATHPCGQRVLQPIAPFAPHEIGRGTYPEKRKGVFAIKRMKTLWMIQATDMHCTLLLAAPAYVFNLY